MASLNGILREIGTSTQTPQKGRYRKGNHVNTLEYVPGREA